MADGKAPSEQKGNDDSSPAVKGGVPFIIKSPVIDEREGEELAISVVGMPDGARLSDGTITATGPGH